MAKEYKFRKKGLDLRQKSDIVTKAINDNAMTELHYKYLRDIVHYLAKRKLSQTPFGRAQAVEDVVQSILEIMFVSVIQNKVYGDIKSIYALSNRMVYFEKMKFDRKQYLGKEVLLDEPDDDDSREDLDKLRYIVQDHCHSEVETVVNIERSLLSMIRSIQTGLNASSLPEDYRSILTYPILLCYLRDDNSLIKKLPPSHKVIAELLMLELKDLKKFI